jgi:hypothetical protein
LTRKAGQLISRGAGITAVVRVPPPISTNPEDHSSIAYEPGNPLFTAQLGSFAPKTTRVVVKQPLVMVIDCFNRSGLPVRDSEYRSWPTHEKHRAVNLVANHVRGPNHVFLVHSFIRKFPCFQLRNTPHTSPTLAARRSSSCDCTRHTGVEY